MSEPREYTHDEVREKFLKKCWGMLEHWLKVKELDGQAYTERERMEGLGDAAKRSLGRVKVAGVTVEAPASTNGVAKAK